MVHVQAPKVGLVFDGHWENVAAHMEGPDNDSWCV